MLTAAKVSGCRPIGSGGIEAYPTPPVGIPSPPLDDGLGVPGVGSGEVGSDVGSGGISSSAKIVAGSLSGLAGAVRFLWVFAIVSSLPRGASHQGVNLITGQRALCLLFLDESVDCFS